MKRKPADSLCLHVPRSVKSFENEGSCTLALSDWRDVEAYVLLGDPGSGKSESLRREAEATDGVYISARDFIALGLSNKEIGKTLFIDGLDEMRAGGATGRVPLDEIRSQLNGYGRPRFRLSCREHDWRSLTDLEALRRVAPSGAVHELHLEPLSHNEQLEILQGRPDEVPEAEAFLHQADQLGLDILFGNPLLLDLTVRALSRGGRPETRAAIYDLACRELVTERSLAHLDAKPLAPGSIDDLLDDAGLLCAVLLLSGKASFERTPDADASSIPWHTLPAALRMRDPDTALASKVFAAISGGVTAPRHRSIAEYLAAKAIAKRLHDGLPLGRVLALMQGGDGGIVEPLRGLLGWLAVHDASNRHQLIRLDPLAIVLNGDVATFLTGDKQVLLKSLGDAAQRNHWFRSRQWVSYPFAPLASPDMADALSAVLDDRSPDASHQALVDCVLDALNHGTSIPSLGSLLELWVEDPSAWFSNRLGALSALKRSGAFDAYKARSWLDRLHDGQLKDRDARLAGQLLTELYPLLVGPEDVLRYWPKAGDVGSNTILPQFWYHGLFEQSRPHDYAVLADAWPRMQPQARQQHDSDVSRLGTGILAGALEHCGDQVSDGRLLAWLRIAVDKHGSSRIDRDSGGERVAQWLTDRPDRLKAILASGWRSAQPDSKTGRRYFWESEQKLHGARKPSDWFHWLLQQAADAPNEELAQYCFSRVAHAVVDPPPGLDVPTIEQVEAWVGAYSHRWPQARDWQVAEWSSRLEDNWQSEAYRHERKHEAETSAMKEERRKAIAPHLAAAIAGTAPASLLHQIASAYDARFYDISGDTPEERVQDFLVSDQDTARAVIARAVATVLDRADLPSAEEVFALDVKGRYHNLRPVALIAARLAHERSPSIVDAWPDSLLATLAAFWLTYGAGETPGWYTKAVELRPAVIAPLLVRHALRRFRRKGELFSVGLWALSHEPGHVALARIVLPQLLDAFPQRASEAARRELNGSLLAALYLLDDETASSIVRRKRDHPSIDAAQRISWLVAELPYSSQAAHRLADIVGTNQRRAVALGVALHEQSSLDRALKRVAATTLSRLIELLAPITQRDQDAGPHWVGPAHQRGDTVRALISVLAGDPRSVAAAELARLENLPRMKPWRDHLRHSLLSQRASAREAGYVHPSPEATALTLANRAPANRTDLAALTVDHLRDIGRHLRGADAFALRHFWRVSDSGIMLPKDENDCRDLLLERLRPRLDPLGIALVPERRAADEKRADLRAEYTTGGRQLAIPVEIKKEGHDTLWMAWRSQLQALYSNDPAADGHGIYLVLWFGHKPRPSPEGDKPDGARSLENMLVERIPTQDRARLTVVVLDLSLPA